MSSSSLQLLLAFSVIYLFLWIPGSSCGRLADYLKDNRRLSVQRDRRAADENVSLNNATRVALGGASYDFLDRNMSLKSAVIVGPVNPTEAVNQIRLSDEIICSTTTITSFVENFKFLRNCTVIEGKLIIGPIDFPEKSFEELSFPHLREISDYLLVYRVTGLKTLRNLFPNLAVIRGKQMFKGNSLVIFENPDMEDLGLVSLTHIQRGGVWVTKNPVLCYLDTLSWKKLLGEEWAKVYHKENRPEDQCVNQCPGNCRTFFSTSHQQERPMCWTTNDCQRVPFPICTAVDQRGCCHSMCIAGCFGAARNECLVCNNVHFNGACHDRCPSSTFEFRGRRCVTEDACHNFTVDGYTRDFKSHVNVDQSGECRRECPANYMTDPLNIHRCVPCSGPCPKTCKSATVTTVDTAERLRQCTIINGSLEIQIGKGEQIIATLEQTLQNIEHVTDYIKIIRSHALLSLSFFKRLRFIGGVNTAPGGYALMVIDNQNLQDLFGFTAERPTLQIGNLSAKVAFHFNPRLCLSKIDVLMNQISVALNKTYDPRDISTTSNGDRVACDISHLNLIVGDRNSEGVMLTWKVFDMPDPRSLLGYVVYYRESASRNLSKYEGREACSGDTWQQIDLPPHEEGEQNIFHALYALTPARQYGVYVTTYTIASERQGAQSDIVYFSTLSKQPSKPVAVTTESVSSSEIRVYWQPPAEPNGQIVHYNVRWQRLVRFDHRQKLRERDYCQNAIVPSKQYFQSSVTTTPLPLAGGATCNCNGSKETDTLRIPAGRTPEEHEDYINMENAIQDMVFVKRRDKRDVSAVLPAADTTSTTLGFIDSSTVSSLNGTEAGNATTAMEVEETTAGNSTSKPKPTVATSNETIHQRQITETQYLIKELSHFTDYVIWVEACHSDEAAQSVGSAEAVPGKFRYTPCSASANANPSQTLALQGADNIPSESVTADFVQQQTASMPHPVIQLTWNDPPAPNGVIVRVDLEYASPERPTPKSECIPRTKPGNELPVYRLDFVGMPSGNYSFRLRASTFAGNGSWTEPVFITYEQPAGPAAGYSPETVAGIVCGCLMIAVVVGIASFCIWKKHFKKDIPQQPNQVSVNPDYYSYTPDEWEVPRENVELIKELGMGSFGKVYLGIAKNILAGIDRLEVAVKTVNEDKSMSERSFFLQEASIMKEFRCAHVVKLLGVVSEGAPALVIMELMMGGDLKTYLRNQRPDEEHPDRTPPLLSRILQMAGEICDGMAYINSRKFVHRDLAARNCMMAADLTVKIGDFGMTRDVYETDYYRKGGKGLLPVRWMAPESLKDGLFTNESDVWSFGVVLWEIATLAAQPYQGLSNEQTLKFVIDGNIMDKPEGCHDMLYDIMKKCWQKNAKDRPTFLQIISDLLPHLSDKFREGGEAYFATVDMNEVLRGPAPQDSEADMPATGDGASPSATSRSPGARVLSIRVKDDVGDEADEEADAAETDTLLNSRYVEPQIVVQQNGGSTVSSADNSKAMVLNYPAVANASVTSDGNMGKTLGNGGASQTSLSARTVY